MKTRAGTLWGNTTAWALIYSDGAGPLISQSLRKYSAESAVLLETTALRDIHGARAEDSYFYTTFNSPVVRLAQGLRCLTYTWGLTGGEGTGIGGNFPDVALADSLAELPEQLRLADFSPNVDLHQTGDKPFAPFIAYDEEERTLVMAPLDHFLISPMRLIDTTYGLGVARGLHGAHWPHTCGHLDQHLSGVWHGSSRHCL